MTLMDKRDIDLKKAISRVLNKNKEKFYLKRMKAWTRMKRKTKMILKNLMKSERRPLDKNMKNYSI